MWVQRYMSCHWLTKPESGRKGSTVSYKNTEEVFAEVEKRKQAFSKKPTTKNAIEMLSAEILLLGYICRELADRIDELGSRDD